MIDVPLGFQTQLNLRLEALKQKVEGKEAGTDLEQLLSEEVFQLMAWVNDTVPSVKWGFRLNTRDTDTGVVLDIDVYPVNLGF